MRWKPEPIYATCLFLCVVNQVILIASPDARALPAGLSEEIAKKYPGTAPVRLSDLNQYDLKLFQKDHGTRCPGMVKADFYGDGKPTWALVVLSGIGPKEKAELLVAHQGAMGWEIRSLDSANASVPVVWTEGPGKYNDVHGEKTIRALHPVIVFAGYSSWAIIYAWTGNAIYKVWIAD
jgi:hypothetical protein